MMSPQGRKSLFRTLFFFGIASLCGGLVGWWLTQAYIHPSCSAGEFNYLNEDIVCGKGTVIDKKAYTALKNDLIDYIEKEKNSGTVTNVALYFRDLEDGPLLGINENDEFSPASLLKLPLAFAIFDAEEREGGFLDKQLLFRKSGPMLEQIFPPAVTLKENEAYSIEALLFNMIAYSDNLAYRVLVEYFNGLPGGPDKILRTFKDLGIIDPRDEMENTLTVRGYASLFRLLYNASFLNKKNSEELLLFLAKSDFRAGLAAGVPEDVVVAHKFGEREMEGVKGSRQLHDCGIVYYPKNPYLLCIMTRGNDMSELTRVVQTISSMFYKEVNSRRM